MGGRRDDDGPARGPLPAVPPPPPRPRPTPRPAEEPRAARLPEVEQASGPARRVWLAVGLVLAAVATAAVFLTENPLVLRIVLLAVCWAFVLAAFLRSGRGGDRVDGTARETELRAAYELELEREVAARHAHEAELEGRLRRESEEAMRGELRQLRTQLGALDQLQDDLAAVSRLRGDLDALGRLSAQLTDLAELRGELAGLAQLRAQLTGVGDLRAELGRLRTEVTEQLSGEVLVERMVMRAQSVRGPAQGSPTPGVDAFGGRTLEGTPDWAAEPQRQAGGWDVGSWATRVDAGAAADDAEPRPVASPPPAPPAEPTRTFAVVDEEQVSRHAPPSPVEWLVGESVLEPWAEPSPRSPREWLDEQSLADDATGELPVVEDPDRPSVGSWAPAPEAPRRHRRAAEPDDDHVSWTDRLRGATPDEPPSYASADVDAPSYGSSGYASPSYDSAQNSPPSEPPSSDSPPYEPPSWLDRDAAASGPATGSTAARADSAGFLDGDGPADGGSTHRAPEQAAAAAPPEPAGHARLAQILAQSGVAAPTGGRSGRRRYREEGQDDGDDVLARVLGRD